jgi:hypothetical protein
MKILRTVAALGIAKKVYDVARKPENQRRIKEAVQRMQAQRGGKRQA